MRLGHDIGKALDEALRGWVTLKGAVEWNYQRNGAETALRAIPWVKGITSRVDLEPRPEAAAVARRLEGEFRAQAEVRWDARLRAWAA